MAAANDPLCRPAKDDELSQPLITVDAGGWLGDSIAGQRVLCLAAGGGRQSSLYAAAGADVTVVDLSGAMLELDRQVAKERGYSLRLLETSMDDLAGLRDREFDLVIHPVSTCYVSDVRPVFAEVARVLRPGGLYISQHKQPTNLQASMERNANGYELQHAYYRDTPVPPPSVQNRNTRRLREQGAVEFLHRWEQLVGGMCRAGFAIEDLVEPMHAKRNADANSFADRAAFVAPYVRIKARRCNSEPNRRGQDHGQQKASTLWIPES
ncbi:class I SAM-dependent methyltransferase [Planctomycetes bacterium K23_9]|uniref:Bifunctional 3-demethylubiquinone-9 3-methyltransferase/ 2-octaprenyl-6-hydroxy phenol methylase n=1 Tax=Stieleria marina TaxID=1930275 RepID=A0A517P1C0_9BACT|nr:bifunctional 3-demethylubiquinone-9 3-methyltransferase/ 2-octaprenyl-6-hydroxy phenol methylase [Planctomycetes bacterium K23_9]